MNCQRCIVGIAEHTVSGSGVSRDLCLGCATLTMAEHITTGRFAVLLPCTPPNAPQYTAPDESTPEGTA